MPHHLHTDTREEAAAPSGSRLFALRVITAAGTPTTLADAYAAVLANRATVDGFDITLTANHVRSAA